MEVKLEKLSASNYSNWKLVVSSLLKYKGLFGYVVAKVEPQEEEDMKKNEEAKHIMYASMEPAQITATGICETAYDLWQKIKENNEGAESSLKNNALAEFLGFKHIRGENIVTYCGRYELALGRLLAAGSTVEEDTKLWVFRNTLPKDLKATVNTWTMANPRGKVCDLISQLKMQYHLDKHDQADSSVALYSNDKRQSGRKPNSNGKNETHPKSQRDQSGNTETRTCNYCKATGHLWKECRKKKEDDKRKKHFAENKKRSNGPSKSGAFTANEVAKPHLFSLNCYSWIVDSGATSHMTAYKEFMVNYSEFTEAKEIVLGNGKTTKAYGEGEVPFKSEEFTGELKSVLWVPGLTENLFSVGRALTQGCEVKFASKTVEFIKRGKTALRGHKLTKGLFVLNLKPIKLNKSAYNNEALTGTSLEDWHKRFSHCSVDAIKELVKKNAVNGIRVTGNPCNRCEQCIMGKICRAHHPSRQIKASESASILHIDTCGPISTASLGGSKYFVLATDEFSDYKFIEFLHKKSEASTVVKRIIHKAELLSKNTVRSITTDNGSEYVNHELDDWLSKKGIIHELTVSYTPEQNGRAERANRTVIEGIRTLLQNCKFMKDRERLWAEAANTFIHTHNLTLSPRDKQKTRFELMTKKKPDVNHLKIFGQRAMIRLNDHERSGKFAVKGVECRFIGYTDRRNTLRFLFPKTEEICTTCDAVFLNTDSNEQEVEVIKDRETAIRIFDNNDRGHEPMQVDGQIEPVVSMEEDSSESEQPNQMSNETGSSYEIDITGSHDDTLSTEESARPQSTPVSRRSTTSAETSRSETVSESDYDKGQKRGDFSDEEVYPTRQRVDLSNVTLRQLAKQLPPPKRHRYAAECAMFTLDDEPCSLKDAQESDDWPKWKKAMDEEIQALNKNKTWEIVDRPPNARPVKNKWVFKVKLDSQGRIERYKARLVAKGFTQIQNVDYKETYAPVASMNTIRIFFAIANQHDMELAQFDVKTAFLYGDLDEDIYMEFPEGYPNPKNKVCRLIKSLYGLKQAPRNWNKKFDSFLKRFDLQQAMVDKCLYYTKDRSMLLAIYVDDGLVASTSKSQLDKLLKYLMANFEMKVMNCEAYLGFKIVRDRKARTLTLLQSHYVDKILERFGMMDCKVASTPEEVGSKFDQSPQLPTENKFKELVGSLLYLVTCTRPDIAHAVSVASRTSEPTQAHWNALKRILRYLKGTRDIGIRFRWEKFPELVGYSDADYANDEKTRRSTSGYCIMYGGGTIAWRCQRQPIVTLSTTEAEYVSGCEMVKELIPIREQLIELHEIPEDKPAVVLIDNQSTIKIATNESCHHRTKHIDVRGKWLNEQLVNKKIIIKHVSGDKQAADILTKPLHKTKFVNNRNMILTALLALLTINMVADTMKLKRVNPLTFRPAKIPVFDGDTEFKLRCVFYNPCEPLMGNFTGQTSINRELVSQCWKDYENKILNKPVSFCTRVSDTALNYTQIRARPACTMGYCEDPPVYEEEKTAVTRKERGVAIPAIVVGAVGLLVGFHLRGNSISTKNAENIDVLAKMSEQQRALLDEAEAVITEMQNNIHRVSNWGPELEKLLNIHLYSRDFKEQVAGLVNMYHNHFTSQEIFLEKIGASKLNGKIAPEVRHFDNQTLWEEPAADWSFFYDCNYKLENRSMVMNLHFNVPIVNNSMKVMEAVPMDFYNATKETNGRESICWMKYKSPKFVMVNTTNNCMTELTENNINGNSVRDQFCVDDKDKMKAVWDNEQCSMRPEAVKRVIQDKEVYGMHRIYCFPYNITIENESQPCPDHVFELESKTTYAISNLRHTGIAYSGNIEIGKDLRYNRDLLTRLKVEQVKISALNLTAMDTAYDKFVSSLQAIPHKLNITNPTIVSFFDDPLSFITDFFGSIWEHIKTLGIIVGSIAGLLMLALIMPIIELLFLGFKVLKIPIKIWYNSLARMMLAVNEKITSKLLKRKKPKYWKHKAMA